MENVLLSAGMVSLKGLRCVMMVIKEHAALTVLLLLQDTHAIMEHVIMQCKQHLKDHKQPHISKLLF